MEKDYLIAGHRIRLTGEQLLEAVDGINGFREFLASETAGSPAGCFVWTEDDGPEMQQLLYKADIEGVAWNFGRNGEWHVLDISSEEGGRLRAWANAETVYLGGSTDVRLLRFACWIGYGLLTVPQQTVSIHSSVICRRGRAVLFLGESGTGKSTHTRLWREHIPGASLLNDDSPFLRICDGKPYVFGSPWSGKTPCFINEGYPVAACVRLSQAPYNRIEMLRVPQAYAALHPSCPPAFSYDDALYESISRTLDRLLMRVPVYHLACLPDADAAWLSCKTIFGL